MKVLQRCAAYTLGRVTMFYNLLISAQWINKNNKVCRRIRGMLYHNICHEYLACFGKRNPEKLFYVIRCSKSDLGFMGLYNQIVYHIKQAIEKGAIPVIDCKYYPNDYLLEDEQVGKINGWEFFFLQPMGISLEEVYKSRNVIMSTGDAPESLLGDVYDSLKLWENHRIIEKYIHLNHSVEEKCIREAERLGFGKHSIMGVKCRGTDFVSAQPKWHSIPPDAQQTIDKIEELIKKWGEYEFIFVATEDEQLFGKMKAYYGNKMISNKTERLSAAETKGKWLNEVFDSGEYPRGYKYDRMLEYLISVWLLAQCDVLVAPVVGATLTAMGMKGQYEHVYLFELGCYGK